MFRWSSRSVSCVSLPISQGSVQWDYYPKDTNILYLSNFQMPESINPKRTLSQRSRQMSRHIDGGITPLSLLWLRSKVLINWRAEKLKAFKFPTRPLWEREILVITCLLLLALLTNVIPVQLQGWTCRFQDESAVWFSRVDFQWRRACVWDVSEEDWTRDWSRKRARNKRMHLIAN